MMSYDILPALIAFAFAASFTPGPNNIMLAASGMNFGFNRTGPHIAGVVVGFTIVLCAAGLGIGTLFAAFPALQTVLKIAGAAYLLWLAWRIANAVPADPAAAARARPLNFLEAAVFQWVNPKGLLGAIGGMTLFLRPESARADFVAVVIVFVFAAIGSASTWAGFGMALRRFIHEPAKLRIFNIAMALLLVASIVPMVWPAGGWT